MARDVMIRRAVRQRKNPHYIFLRRDISGKWHKIWIYSKNNSELVVYGTRGMVLDDEFWVQHRAVIE